MRLDKYSKYHEVQMEELSMLNQWNKFVEAKELVYTLIGKSLWSAVQYKGIMPWDHGIYVLIERKNLSIIVQEFSCFLEEKYRLLPANINGDEISQFERAFYIAIKSNRLLKIEPIFYIYFANKESFSLNIRRQDLVYRRILKSLIKKNYFSFLYVALLRKEFDNRLKYEDTDSDLTYADNLRPSIKYPNWGLVRIKKTMNVFKVNFDNIYAYIPIKYDEVIQRLYGISKYSLDDLHKIQYALLELLTLFHLTCSTMQIKYSLASGTLLGAIRDNGFIPWDDDIDVVLDVPEYKRFLLSANDFFKDKARLYRTIADNGKSMGSYYAVLVSKKIITLSDGRKVNPYIDIFPLNRESNFDFKRKIDIFYRETLEYLRRLNWSHMKNENANKKNVQFLNRVLLKAIIRNREKYNNYLNKYKYTFADYFHPNVRESFTKLINAELYNKVEETDFEGKNFCVAVNYNKLLNLLYGNWEVYPDFKNQIPVHIYNNGL